MHQEHIACANHHKELGVNQIRVTWAIKQMSVFHQRAQSPQEVGHP